MLEFPNQISLSKWRKQQTKISGRLQMIWRVHSTPHPCQSSNSLSKIPLMTVGLFSTERTAKFHWNLSYLFLSSQPKKSYLDVKQPQKTSGVILNCTFHSLFMENPADENYLGQGLPNFTVQLNHPQDLSKQTGGLISRVSVPMLCKISGENTSLF